MRIDSVFTRFVLIVAAAVGVGLSTAPAQATTQVWTFSGTCFDCTDSIGELTSAAGILTLKDYTTGAALTTSNYVSFTYGSQKYPSISFGAIAGLTGALHSGMSNVAITRAATSTVNYFGTATNGSWSLIQQFPSDLGFAGHWALTAVIPDVPEPSSWLMMMIGFGALGVIVRRPRQSMVARLG